MKFWPVVVENGFERLFVISWLGLSMRVDGDSDYMGKGWFSSSLRETHTFLP